MSTRAARKKAPEVVPSETAPKAAHDTRPPDALLDFMMQGWKAKSGKLPPKLKGHAAFKKRRDALSARFPGETLVIPTGHEKVRANDTNFRFRPGSDFYYLTGNTEPDCVLVLEPRKRGGGHTHLLFVEPNPGRSDSTFYTDRSKGELWVGPRLGVVESQARFVIDECRGLPELPDYLSSLGGRTRVLRGYSEGVDGKVGARQAEDRELATVLSEMRLIKDAQEVHELQAAVDSTKRGFEDVIERLAHAKTEREVEGVFNLRARVEGNDVGYGTIAASGANACILHWTRNDATIRPGELLLLDAGVERDTLYTADITRTLPVSGKFSKEQKEIYELVLEAQD
ncbi:MAG TPA: aminopeptidase P N-terminal domain-containing protein, partial [Vulgatibacter sp.]